MASYSVDTAKVATLSGTTVDTVTFTGGVGKPVAITNITGAGALSVLAGQGTVADPTALGDNTFTVPSGRTVVIQPGRTSPSTTDLIVKIIGNGNQYAAQTGVLDVT
jgi:hypothetical protein